jgi:pimeloyl-ACP methyl ester carboxylesterase
MTRREVDIPIGRIRYRDEGAGPPVVFVHGIFVDGGLWQPVIDRLRDTFRCLAPDWPLGAHILPARPGADLSPHGVARAIADLLEALDLREVTLVANDTGGAITQLLLASGCDRVSRVVLTPCDSFSNFPPPAIGFLPYAPRIPGALTVGAQLLRLHVVQKRAYQTVAKHPIPPETMAGWVRPFITDKAVRSDLGRFLRAIDNADTLAAADQLRTFDKPVLLVWPRKAPFFPFSHAQRWAELLPNARLVEVPDSYTYVSLDQPDFLAHEISTFAADHESNTTLPSHSPENSDTR